MDIFVSDKDYAERVAIDLHGDEPKPVIAYPKFEEVSINLMDSHEFEPDGPEVLLAAFRALDTEGVGYLEADKLSDLMTDLGEPPFREKEVEAFLKTVVDKETGRVYYEDYVALMSR
ncbi:hypothetical protein EON68_00110 [archaeon]|nr:MAG: hypothetical protein EON68_00110 [archaeon]